MRKEKFVRRHIGPSAAETQEMLQSIGTAGLDRLTDEVVPAAIRLKNPLGLQPALSEREYLEMIGKKAAKNKVFRSFIGQGYYGTFTPSVILRNIFESPYWYTAYTPYQAEISQGRMESLLNFQTLVTDLTGLPLANASLLDEGTAAAEAMSLLLNSRSKEQEQNNAMRFWVSNAVFAQTIDVLITRAEPLGIEIVLGDAADPKLDGSFFGALLQYPNAFGEVEDYKAFTEMCHAQQIKVAVATDLLALTLLAAPGEWGADVAFGSAQRLGVPMGFGGPHAAFFCAREEYKRQMPGRIIGVTIDAQGNHALRMALQTREQHIKRDKATSNICTAQALLANMAAMYAVYHGPEGLKEIASNIHGQASVIYNGLKAIGAGVINTNFFDTLFVKADSAQIASIRKAAEAAEINFFYGKDGYVGISCDELTTEADAQDVLEVFGSVYGKNAGTAAAGNFLGGLDRTSDYLQYQVFNAYHSETELMRYISRLERKDIGLNYSMIALGSCTMKLNAASELIPLSRPEFSAIHPFAPQDQVQGYLEIINELSSDLCSVTGFDAMSLQPNSGAQGEYAGLMVVRSYFAARGETQRKIALIPSSAHGTNPASAVMAGMDVVVVKCDELGNIDVADLQRCCDQYGDSVAVLMVTYPSTHGVYEERIMEITSMVHAIGGQVYMDGANMNAQVGLTSPGNIGADVCHLNLHKTFAIPHGGGGPGMGPIGVRKHLAPYLPGHVYLASESSTHAVSAAPFGSALILLISYAYIKMLGADGLTESTRYAILNANYLKDKLKDHFTPLYTGNNGRVAHEFIADCRDFKRTAGIEVVDIAKRLMDFGYHAPTVSFPVAGTLMIEPTESEGKQELDKFIEVMIRIREEIREIENGTADKADNVLKNAPHTCAVVLSDAWDKPYSREKAAFPVARLRTDKFWPSVGRVNEAYGDRNLVCTCLPLEAYQQSEVSTPA
ncbi:MAG: aminomethyl-transferring glycine dehydrogenase [Bacteroidia bacterium]|nr:aminomethyl-transferring glycine dehydrogenase [Bacteroidia bacterium]